MKRACSLVLCGLLVLSIGLASVNSARAIAPFKKEFDKVLGLKIDLPVFSKEVKEMAGKEVTIKGYIIPTDGYKSQQEFVFSAFPYNMCFFCGGAGPETVMEVSTKDPIKYTTEPIYLKGILKLNGSDVNRLIYSLEKAVKL